MTTSELRVPTVDDERIQETYSELKEMLVVLDSDPIEHGPRRFNNRIAQVRSLLNRVEQLSLQASEDLHYFKRIINAKRGLYELEKRELLVKDPSCRVGRSQSEREALADVRLRTQIEEIQLLEAAAHDLETIMISIRTKRTDLKDVQGRMRDQMKLIEHELSMGARWGSRDPTLPPVVGSGSEDLDALLSNVEEASQWRETAARVGAGEEDEEGDEETPKLAPVSSPKKGTTKGNAEKVQPSQSTDLEPVLVLEAPASEGDENSLDVALRGEGGVPQFGDGDLVAPVEVDSFLSELDDVLAVGATTDVPTSADDGIDGIDDLIASLVND